MAAALVFISWVSCLLCDHTIDDYDAITTARLANKLILLKKLHAPFGYLKQTAPAYVWQAARSDN
jgi:hypothetical protein